MNRVWFDQRPGHLRDVVGWWEWHTRWRFSPGRCRECRQPRRQPHKLSCSHRSQQLAPPTPWYVFLGIGVGVTAVDMAIVYILAMTGLPNTAGLWGWITVCAIIMTAFNWLVYVVYRDWQLAR